VRSVRPDEVAARVEAHRAAWRPPDMPWPTARLAEIDPAATSSFTEEKYARCRATWLYDAELDLVAVAPDGSFAANCLAWLDPSTGVAEIEPLGVHPAHRRRGLAGALCQEVARRVTDRGGREVFINTGPNEAYPAPPAAYAKAGFRTVRRGTIWVRPA
jgi:GNAT superfamily N-acetyltransferase